MRTEIAKALGVAGAEVQYDTQVKNVLANKIILAWILQRSVCEFKGMSVDEIIPCIEGKPEISAVRVNPGETNAELPAEKIIGMQNEDKVAYEGAIYYDIRFYVKARQGRMKMIINVEAQKNIYPGYAIETRGIFYASRMISSQLGTEFIIPNYDDIKKVYSIWICMNYSEKVGNAISEYHIVKEDILPGIQDKKDAYDKISVVMIALNGKIKSDDRFINMMNLLLSPEKTFTEKKDELSSEYAIPMETDLGRELDLMCNLSGYVKEQGLEQGIEQGVDREKKNTIIRMLEKKYPDEEILQIADVSAKQLEAVKAEILALK